MNRFFLILVSLFIVFNLNAGFVLPQMEGDTGLFKKTYCSLQPVLINNNPYSPSNPSGLEKIPGGAFNGQDSFFRVELVFTVPSVYNYTPTVCETDTIYINGKAYHAFNSTGTEIIPSGAASGCDSIINVNLDILASPYFVLNDTLCPDDKLVYYGEVFDISRRFGLVILPGASYRGCDSLVNVSLDFRETWVFAGPNRYVTEGDTICTEIQAKYPPLSVTWTPTPPCGSPSCMSFCTDTLLTDQQYSLKYTDIYGCHLEDQLFIGVDNQHEIYAPNIFRPEADRPNDRFFIRGDSGVKKVKQLLIFDRWGEPVFKTTDMPNDDTSYYKGWDGTWRDRNVEQGVYGWWAEFEIFTGSTFFESGTVTLVR